MVIVMSSKSIQSEVTVSSQIENKYHGWNNQERQAMVTTNQFLIISVNMNASYRIEPKELKYLEEIRLHSHPVTVFEG